MADLRDTAREALKAQGFETPGPMLIDLVTDALARQEEQTPAGERLHRFNPAELLRDTPELVDRTVGPLTDPGTETSYLIANIINEALRYVEDDEDADLDS